MLFWILPCCQKWYALTRCKFFNALVYGLPLLSTWYNFYNNSKGAFYSFIIISTTSQTVGPYGSASRDSTSLLCLSLRSFNNIIVSLMYSSVFFIYSSFAWFYFLFIHSLNLHAQWIVTLCTSVIFSTSRQKIGRRKNFMQGYNNIAYLIMCQPVLVCEWLIIYPFWSISRYPFD